MFFSLLALPAVCAGLIIPRGNHREILQARQDSAQIYGGGQRTTSTVSSGSIGAAVTAGISGLNAILPSATKSPIPLPTLPWKANYALNHYSVPSPIDLPSLKTNNKITSEGYNKLSGTLSKVLDRGIEITDKSWELGALVQSLLEVYNPELTPFAYDSTTINSTTNSIPWSAMKVALSSLWRTDWSGAPSEIGVTDKPIESFFGSNPPVGIQSRALINGDGSLGDPAAIGAGTWLLAQYAGREEIRDLLGMRSKEDYAWATANQWAYLNNGYKSENGTISQREGHFELWADMGYMIPPFPAYIGLATSNVGLIRQGITQWNLEASALVDKSSNLFRHVHYWDTSLWCTGQAWMLGGAMRVVASAYSAGVVDQVKDLLGPMEEQLSMTLYSVFGNLGSDNLVPNYIDQKDAGDAAGTALIVASFYRFYTYFPNRVNQWLRDQAEKAFDAVVNKIDGDGWVTQVVDPDGTDGFYVYLNMNPPMRSPEGQAFTGMMWAARTAAGI